LDAPILAVGILAAPISAADGRFRTPGEAFTRSEPQLSSRATSAAR
jgi:hypothetical protein